MGALGEGREGGREGGGEDGFGFMPSIPVWHTNDYML